MRYSKHQPRQEKKDVGTQGLDLFFDETDWDVEGNGQYLSAGDWETGKTWTEWDPITGNIGIQTLNFGPLLPFFEQTQLWF